MGYLKKQWSGVEYKACSVRLPADVYDDLAEFAIERRLFLATAVTHFIRAALKAEGGQPYVPYSDEGREAHEE